MQTVTNLISSLATGTTVLLGQKIGQKKPSEGGKIAGASLILFALIGIAFSLLLTLGAAPLSRAMNAPEAAFLKTVHYLSICGGGALIMIFYNLIGGLFRGMGDSRTPFIAVAIACVSNIVLDLLMVAVYLLVPPARPWQRSSPKPSASLFPITSSPTGPCPLQ